jgi:hypothetical protein
VILPFNTCLFAAILAVHQRVSPRRLSCTSGAAAFAAVRLLQLALR